MKWQRAVIVAMILSALGVGLLAGCGKGDSSSSGAPAGHAYMVARLIQDGAPKYFEYQQKCPVCDEGGLLAEQYVDVDGRRIYFDMEACKKSFQENQSKFLEKLDQRKKEWDQSH